MKTPAPVPVFLARLVRNEDWLAVLVALLLIVLSALGLLGKNGIPISF